MIKILLFLSIFLTGCAAFDSPVNKIGYIADSSNITWMRYDTQQEVEQACNKLGLIATAGNQILACAQWNVIAKTCVIHAQVPETLDDEATTNLGHEFLHCFTGLFHN